MRSLESKPTRPYLWASGSSDRTRPEAARLRRETSVVGTFVPLRKINHDVRAQHPAELARVVLDFAPEAVRP